MKRSTFAGWWVLPAALAAAAPAGGAQIETVAVGDAANAGELSSGGLFVPDRICGAVGYPYAIGTFEVTAGQYCEFLNAVAKTDTYGLYNESMAGTAAVFSNGCGIVRTGTAGSYGYAVADDWADRPVNFVSWGDAARFCNWLTNGQPVGPQDAGTTEDGGYTLGGATDLLGLMAVTRNAGECWALPTEDEWHKAAYYDPGKAGGAGYWDYATATDAEPDNDLVDPDPGNHANFWQSPDDIVSYDDFTVGPPHFTTEVGEFESSPSPYGTYDQSGNVIEWTETPVASFLGYPLRAARGGSFASPAAEIQAARRMFGDPTDEDPHAGFRVAWVPEPGALVLLALAAAASVRRRRRRP